MSFDMPFCNKSVRERFWSNALYQICTCNESGRTIASPSLQPKA